MIKLILPFVAAFLVALGGSTYFAISKAKQVAAATPKPQVAAPVESETTEPAAHDTLVAHAAITPHRDSAVVAAPGAATDTGSRVAVPASGLASTVALAAPTPLGAPAPNAASHDVPVASAPEKRSAMAPAARGGVTSTLLPSGLVGERLGKIFASMPAKEAAKVLGKMEDADISIILGRLNDKKAAEILAQLPTERAVAISRVALAKGRTGASK